MKFKPHEVEYIKNNQSGQKRLDDKYSMISRTHVMYGPDENQIKVSNKPFPSIEILKTLYYSEEDLNQEKLVINGKPIEYQRQYSS